MRIVNTSQYIPDSLVTNKAELLFATGTTVDGDLTPFKEAPVGSLAWVTVTANQHEVHMKVLDNDNDYDWVMIRGVIHKNLALSDFTDGGAAAGTYTFTETIPIGAIVDKCWVSQVVAFAGTTTSVIIVGDGTDTDRYNTGTPSVQTATAGQLAMGIPSGTLAHATAKAPVVTITEDDDFTDIVTGSLKIAITYHG